MMGRVCDVCHGARSTAHSPVCPACNGTGTSEAAGQTAPAFFTTSPGLGQQTTVCDACGVIAGYGEPHICLPLVLDMMRNDRDFLRELAALVAAVQTEEHTDE